MGLHYENLTEDVRAAMVHELKHDVENGTLYISSRLTTPGAEAWPELLQEAAEQHDDTWLASTLRAKSLIKTHEPRSKRNGSGFTIVKVPHNAAETLAEGEFNRLYIRGLCLHVLDLGGTEVEVYRGKDVKNPRPESEAMIGRRLPAQKLLDDLRASHGVEPALGLPSGPNSGLTVRRA